VKIQLLQSFSFVFGSSRNNYLVFLIMIFCSANLVLAQDTMYYNNAWKPCKKKEASFMRTTQKDLEQINVIDFYYPSKKVQMTGSYSKIEGSLEIENGFFQYFTKGGIKTSSGVFIQGKKEGNWKYFYPNGSVFQSWNFKDNKSNGNCFTYYENGRVMRKEAYRMNKLIQQYCYDETGKEISCIVFQNDSLNNHQNQINQSPIPQQTK
jgi:antitoxin component YwqK of YwqJK toxin-antitoxin module